MQHIWLPFLTIAIVILLTEYHIEVTIIDRTPEKGDKSLKKDKEK